MLKEDEDITEVWYAADEKCIKGIQFGTSQGGLHCKSFASSSS